MRLNGLTKDNCTMYGTGPERSVMLCYEAGLGTCPHALPVIAQMIEDGYAIEINCREFQAPIFRALGITVTTHSKLGPAWVEMNKHRFSRIVSLTGWEIWHCADYGFHAVGTMQQFSQILDAPLPESFSWVDALKPNRLEFLEKRPYILFNPNASEKWRSLPSGVADAIEQELRMEYDVVRLEGNECEEWQDLLDLVYNAAAVVTVECGISNIAGCLNVPMVCMTGLVEIQSTVEQYRCYIPDLNYIEVRGYQPKGCAMPCYRMPERGFTNGKCVGTSELPLCMVRTDIPKVLESIHSLTKVLA